MSSLAYVLAWKFNNQPGIKTVDGSLVAFPGGVPSQAEIDVWTSEYELYKAKSAKCAAVDALYLGQYGTCTHLTLTWGADAFRLGKSLRSLTCIKR